jgi:hypothetical protein
MRWAQKRQILKQTLANMYSQSSTRTSALNHQPLLRFNLFYFFRRYQQYHINSEPITKKLNQTYQALLELSKKRVATAHAAT